MMRGLTIGVGNYREMAERAAASVRRFAGIEVDVVTECQQNVHPSAYRLALLLEYSEPVLWFDADTLMLADWDPDEIAGPFAAMIDRPGFGQAGECQTYGIDVARYFNSGVLIVRSESLDAIQYAWDMVQRPEYRSVFQEQTALNVAIQRLAVPVTWLPDRFNHFADDPLPDDCVMIHGAGPNRAAFDRLARELWNG